MSDDMVIPDDVLSSAKATSVQCMRCGARAGRACYGNGDMRQPHPERYRAARDRLLVRWAREAALREAEEAVRPNYRVMMLTGVDTSGLRDVNDALHRAADRLAALRSGTADTNPKGDDHG